jgi:hypothetical protein
MPKAGQAKRKKLLAAFFARPEIAAFYREAGRRGGKVGGRMRTDAMTSAERTALGKKAALAR